MSRKDWTDDKLLFRLINNKTEKTRWDNIQVLRDRVSQELFSKSVELTKSDNPKIRKIGIDILAQLGETPRPFLNDTLKVYFDLLDVETNPDVLMSLLYSVGHNNDSLSKKQIDKVCSFISNENDWVKEGLVFALLGIDNTNAIKTLIKLSSDKLSHVRDWATFGIGSQIERNNKYIREALWERVNDKHQETKLEAIMGLAKRNDKRVNKIIRDELINQEHGILLLEAVIETQNKEFLPLLRNNLNTIIDDNSIDFRWKKDLKNCIDELTKLTSVIEIS
ncbi:hypothetical protein [Chishuiella changwenlii]|uniref:hypothetical protein n=1 Tax=Chishuiella changwenlii TaxID=1434701 RepID=UPI002FD97B86